MEPTTRVRIPRLYIFIILIAILFSVVNIIVLYYAENLVLYIGAVWGWISLLIMSLVGTLLIGMYIAYRLLAMRSFTPFEREMMEMRVDVADMKKSLEEVRGRLDAKGASAGGSAQTTVPPGQGERERPSSEGKV